MPLLWNDPKTWDVSELLTADDFNEFIRDCLLHLFDSVFDVSTLNESADFTTTSTSFVNVDQSGGNSLELTGETAGESLLVYFSGTIKSESDPTPRYLCLDITVDGVRHGGDDGILVLYPGGDSERVNASFIRLVQNLDPGAHTIILQWKVSTSDVEATLYAGAGTSQIDMHPQFGAIRV